MDLFYHIDQGKSYKYMNNLKIFYNFHFNSEEIQIPVLIDNNVIKLVLEFFIKYNIETNKKIELCFKDTVHIFTELSDELLFNKLQILCKAFFENNVKIYDDNLLYPIRKISYPPSNINNPSYEYIKSYEKDILYFRIESFYGYNITFQPKYLNKIFDRKKYEDKNFKPAIFDVDESDLITFLRLYGEYDKIRHMLKYSPYSPAQTIYNFANNNTINIIKKYYNINNIEDVKTSNFRRRLSKPSNAKN